MAPVATVPAVATTAALVVGKVVLVVDKLPFLRHFDYAPLVQPVLFKSIVYTFFVFVARFYRGKTYIQGEEPIQDFIPA